MEIKISGYREAQSASLARAGISALHHAYTLCIQEEVGCLSPTGLPTAELPVIFWSSCGSVRTLPSGKSKKP